MRRSDKARESAEVSNSYFAYTGKSPMRQWLKKSPGQNYESGGQEFESLRARHHSPRELSEMSRAAFWRGQRKTCWQPNGNRLS
jgi:hypothetical protein